MWVYTLLMAISVKYFAGLRERMNRAGDILPAQDIGTVADVWNKATHGAPWPTNMLAALNQDYAEAHSPVQDGDEVAFFPPVTGG